MQLNAKKKFKNIVRKKQYISKKCDKIERDDLWYIEIKSQ